MNRKNTAATKCSLFLDYIDFANRGKDVVWNVGNYS